MTIWNTDLVPNIHLFKGKSKSKVKCGQIIVPLMELLLNTQINKNWRHIKTAVILLMWGVDIRLII